MKLAKWRNIAICGDDIRRFGQCGQLNVVSEHICMYPGTYVAYGKLVKIMS